jgi:hypothetical protein
MTGRKEKPSAPQETTVGSLTLRAFSRLTSGFCGGGHSFHQNACTLTKMRLGLRGRERGGAVCLLAAVAPRGPRGARRARRRARPRTSTRRRLQTGPALSTRSPSAGGSRLQNDRQDGWRSGWPRASNALQTMRQRRKQKSNKICMHNQTLLSVSRREIS